MIVGFRDATPSDAATLDRIFKTSFSDTFAHLYSSEDLKIFLSGFTLGVWEGQLSDPAYAFHVGEVDGKTVGYVKLGPMDIPFETGGPAILLSQFYVLKEHHGAGIAGELMEWILAEAKRRCADELYLTVFIENHRAIRFYERYGFEVVGRYDFMVGSQADEDIIMRKTL